MPALLPVEESLRNQFEHLSNKVRESEDKLKLIKAENDSAKKFEELEVRMLKAISKSSEDKASSIDSLRLEIEGMKRSFENF